jgi:hypothetical protein
MEPTSKDKTASANIDRVKMVVYSKSTKQPPVLAALVQQLEAQKGRLEFEVLREASGILRSVEQTTMTVLVLTLHEKEELVEVLNVLTQMQSRIQSGLLRAMILNGMNHPRVIALLKAKGVQEILDFNTNIKALNHKIKNAFLVLTQTFQRLQNQNIRASTVVGNDAAARGARGARNESTTEITWEKPTEHANDIWWIPSVKNLRNVMGRWLIDMLGPGPAAGFWEETTYERNGEKGWVWKIRVSTDPTFMPKPGRWIFFGRQPEFVWQKNLWAFVSKMPYLAFYAEGQSESEFVRIDPTGPGRLKVYENSEVARLYLPKIQASLEASLKLSKAEASNEIRGNFDGGNADSSVGGTDFMPSGTMPSGTTAANYSSSGGGEAPAPGWNDHSGAVGFGFKAKDLRVAEDKAKAKWRNALTSEVDGLGGKLGLEDIKQAGLVSGAKSFDKMTLEVRPHSRNGAEIAKKNLVRVIEMTATRGTFEFPQPAIIAEDRFIFKVEFRLADVEKKFDLEWTVESVQPIDGAGSLVEGAFAGVALAELAQILKLVAQRQLELKDFFLVAKGA